MIDRMKTFVLWSAVIVLGMEILPGQEVPAPPRQPPLKPLRPAAPPMQPADAPAQPDQIVRIFKLQYVQLDKDMQEALSILGGPAKFAFDARTNSLIVQATEDKLPSIENYLKEVDRPQAPKETKQIRLVWLVGGLPEARKPPPEDLEKVIGELGKLGFDDLQLVAQTIIQTTPDGTFKVSSNPTLGKSTPCDLSLSGTLRVSDPRTNQLNVSVEVSSQGRQPIRGGMPGMPPQPLEPPQIQVQTAISTSITAPPGHPVVLCASPVEKATSVFIIQVMAPEGR